MNWITCLPLRVPFLSCPRQSKLWGKQILLWVLLDSRWASGSLSRFGFFCIRYVERAGGINSLAIQVLARAAPVSRHLVIQEWISVLIVGAASLLPAASWLIETLAVMSDQNGSWLLSIFFQVRHLACVCVLAAMR